MRFAAGLLLMAAVAAAPWPAMAASSELADRQSEAEKQQAALRDRIGSLQKEIDGREAARKEAADALKESESAISRINRRLRELADDNRRAEAELAGLNRQIGEQQQALQQRRAQLAEQLRTQYTSGLSPWTALLSGDDPQQLGRNLGYLGYVSRARAQAVHALRQDIDRLAQLQGQADARRADIQAMAAEAAEQKTELVAQQKERATLLARLEGQIAAQRAEARQLGRDDNRLSRLIGDLETAIAEQAEAARRAEEARRRAEAVRRAQEARLAEEARRKAEAERRAEAARQARRSEEARDAARAREQVEAAAARERERGPVALADPDAAGLKPAGSGSGRVAPPSDARPAARPDDAAGDTPDDEAARRPAPRRAAAPPPGGGNGLHHGLPVPVRGTVQGRFGVDRPDGGVWRGIVLRAAAGTPVKAVAPGTVVYANWLRGFGNLIIVDHGKQYLTVYAYNQSLLKQVGDPVAAGDAIATVGATGGQVESGLYFEIRYRGAPVDPAQWLAL
ncbi:murein hydrolase activator EnvC family protein [Bordetella petrii]|uniref:murein hydrolase activator EnvC family protein n=1 Tax=Bordetella petrii TaxID=94624 RepID=UPI001A96C76B|nr:peptidoglycan DD-metalloendopeptidase family protein [Bordetella petrii]MBO1112290.1 peptidoglycan DD-metalloendopeptidase family protein [Bordetella petrii]